MNINIGHINLLIETNILWFEKDILTPNAYSLHTNWLYHAESDTNMQWIIKIEERAQKEISTLINGNTLIITGDFSVMRNKGFNPQFALSGNKWIISKFISHINEINHSISLHACALYHPHTCKILIGIGVSWSGKTAFISSGIWLGWQVIATEMLQIHEDGTIFLWNHFDTIGENAISFFHAQPELGIPIFENKKIYDQIGYKCLADFSWHKAKPQKFHINNAEIIFLQFGNQKFQNAEQVYDVDMSLRFLGQSASEKSKLQHIYETIYFLFICMEMQPYEIRLYICSIIILYIKQFYDEIWIISEIFYLQDIINLFLYFHFMPENSF